MFPKIREQCSDFFDCVFMHLIVYFIILLFFIIYKEVSK